MTNHGGPSCSLGSADSEECDLDGFLIVETGLQDHPMQGSASSAVKISGGQRVSSAAHIQPSVSQGRKIAFFCCVFCFIQMNWAKCHYVNDPVVV